jgi:choline dehydrogenase
MIRPTHLALSCLSILAAACTTPNAAAPGDPNCTGKCDGVSDDPEAFEYIVVGAGAGGGTVASRLAELGHRVLLVEAGDFAPETITNEVPALHPQASEDPALSWEYFVNHYSDPERSADETKFEYGPDGEPLGVFYPRGATVGGSTAVHAMISIYPHEQDWRNIEVATGDPSWRGSSMREYFVRLEENLYVDRASGHGYAGWQPISTADATLAFRDAKLIHAVKGAAYTAGTNLIENASQFFGLRRRDLNSADPTRDAAQGVFQIPSAIRDGRRVGVRERIVSTIEAGHPLTLYTRSLATRVLWDEETLGVGEPRAVGVEILQGAHLYRGDRRRDQAAEPVRREVFATREVILSAGAFNTPQLLMLSGIGPESELALHGIDTVVDAPVGRNLQDRYEVPVIVRSDEPYDAAVDCAFDTDVNDGCMREWLEDGGGFYGSNGGVVGMVRRSRTALTADPDLFIFGLPGAFRGYTRGYSEELLADPHLFTWLVLKAHNGNRGTVRLRSSDARDTPLINFQYFGDPAAGVAPSGEHLQDLQSMVEGVRVVREIIEEMNDVTVFAAYTEESPGLATDTDEEISELVMNESWGHHASCTVPIGHVDDADAVLDSEFRVKGTRGLRVVDASVFPEIPGFFPVVAVMMVGEKAADVIHGGAEALD